MIRAAVKRVYKCMLDICGSFGSEAVGNSSSSRNNEVTMGRTHSADAPPPKRSKRLQEKSSPRPRGSSVGGPGGGCSVFSGGGGVGVGGGGGGALSNTTAQASPCVAAATSVSASTRARHSSNSSARRRTPCLPPSGTIAAVGAAAVGVESPVIGLTEGAATGAYAPSRANIGDLPPEVLLEVFSYFNVQELESSVSRVCELWRDLSRRACLRRELALNGEAVDTTAACELLRGCPHLEALVISGRADAEALLRQVALHNRELRRLAIKRCYGSPSRPYLAAHLLNKLLCRCPRLVDLTIKQSIFRSNKFFRDLGVMLPEIRRINLNFSSSFGSDALKMIALRCSKLEEIRALRKRTPNSTVPHCCDQDAALLAQRLCATLRVLKLDGAMLSDEGLAALSQCSHLRTLYVRHAYSVTDTGAAHLIRLRCLESLDLTGMGQVSPAGWARLFGEARWTGMRRLSLALCLTVNDDTLRHVAAACPHLLKLVLAGCMHVTEDGLTAIIQACALLESLNICLAHVYVFSSFVWIPSHTPHLRRLVYHPYGLEEENLILKFLSESLPTLDIVRVEHPVEGIIREM